MIMKIGPIGMVGVIAVAVSLLAGPATGDEREEEVELEERGEWRDHMPPFDFLFDNHIDTHQQTKLRSNGELSGALFIIFTGENDPDSGLPIARHPRGAMHAEDCAIDVDCVVGWKLRAKPGEAKFLFHSGVNGNDHPVWAVNRVDIPQPGSFTHFHWIGFASTDSRAGQVPLACDVEMAGQLEGDVAEGTLVLNPETPDGQWDNVEVHLGGGAEDMVCPGWFLQLRAVKSFAFQHGGGLVPVRPRIDNATHLNLLTNYAVVPEITPSR
ncbi:MAG: hypothetical protein OER56_15005 [Hyphomicrobiales bacterium]|nr:hypothetical protein [Hyphomicrobiales bacterium]